MDLFQLKLLAPGPGQRLTLRGALGLPPQKRLTNGVRQGVQSITVFLELAFLMEMLVGDIY